MPFSQLQSCWFTRCLVVVLVVCLVACATCEMVDAGALEMFVDADSKYTPDDTYFNISKTDPQDKTNSSSSNLQKMKAKADEHTSNSPEQTTTTTTTTTTTDEYHYWFWDGTEYSKKDIAETMHIVSIWKDNCPKTCELWIQIGGDTQPIDVSTTDISTLKQTRTADGVLHTVDRNTRQRVRLCDL